MFRKQRNLFISPTQHYPIYDINLPFANYIEECKTLIANTRLDLTADANKIIAANSPFELRPENKPPKYGVLMIHGLFDSPFVMRDISKHWQMNGALIRAILLPGHGTIPGGLLDVSYHDWIQTVRYGIATLAKEVDKIFIVGFSTGAMLGLHYALQGEKKIAGLIFAAPAFKIHTFLDVAQNWHRIISWAWPRLKWVNIQAENNYATYKSCAMNAGYQLYLLIQEVTKLNKANPLTCPLFMVLSQDDATVTSRVSVDYFQTLNNPSNRLILYSNNLPTLNDSRITVRPTEYPEQHIENLSHPCILYAPDNSYYGQHGDYIYASRIDEANTIYTETSKVHFYLLDLLLKLKLTNKKYLRTTYNPDFDYMISSIHEFLAPLIEG